MANVMDILKLCRLCLVKDEVNVPIFESQGDLRQIFLKITACLPVKVSRQDSLPKNICNACLVKLEVLYEFWNTTVNSEKQLITWLNEAGVETINANVLDADNSHSIHDTIILKQEAVDVTEKLDQPSEDLSTDAKSYILQQQQLPYEPPGFDFQNDFTNAQPTAPSSSKTSEPPAKRKRVAATKRKQPQKVKPEEDSDEDSASEEALVAKVEEDSDDGDDLGGDDGGDDGDLGGDDSFDEDAPSTSVDEQPGPSGVGKAAADAPRKKSRKLSAKGETPVKEDVLLSCPYCDKFTTTTTRLLRIHLTCHNDRIFLCSICGKGSKRREDLRKHLRTHDDTLKDKFGCDLCDKRFRTITNLTNHKARHNKQYRTFCEECGKGFFTNREYKAHFDKVHQGISYPCDICSKTFTTIDYYRRHRKLSHDPNYDKARFECDFCKKTFHHKGTFEMHVNSVHKKLKSLCDICGKELYSDQNLRAHMRVHTGERPYTCNLCGKGFKKKSVLDKHERVHTRERPFKCSMCDKCFSQKPVLNMHIKKAHTDERPFSCPICQKAYPMRCLLNTHMKGHGTAMKDVL